MKPSHLQFPCCQGDSEQCRTRDHPNLWTLVCVIEESQAVKWQTAHRVGTGTVLCPKPASQELAITHIAIRKLGSLGRDRVVVKVKYGSAFKLLMPGLVSHPFGSCSLQESEAPGMSQDGRQDIIRKLSRM